MKCVECNHADFDTIETKPGQPVKAKCKINNQIHKWSDECSVGIWATYEPEYVDVVVKVDREMLKKLGYKTFPKHAEELVSAITCAINNNCNILDKS